MPPLSRPLLRASLSLSPANGGKSGFILPLKRILIDYCEHWGSNRGMREYIAQGHVVNLAKEYPGVEVIVRRRENRHPHVKGVYANGRDKTICVRNLTPTQISTKLQLLLDSSGDKIQAIKRPSVMSETESVRGIWSQFHQPPSTDV